MPVTYHRRPERCTGCGDVVLIAERSLGAVFGLRVMKEPTIHLEHADPGLHGEPFDAVDDGCRRPRVAP